MGEWRGAQQCISWVPVPGDRASALFTPTSLQAACAHLQVIVLRIQPLQLLAQAAVLALQLTQPHLHLRVEGCEQGGQRFQGMRVRVHEEQ